MTNDPPARLCANRVWFKCCHQRHATVPPSASSCQSDHRCLHSTGHIPYIQTVLHTLHSSSTPASHAAFIFFVVTFPDVSQSLLMPVTPQLMIVVFLAHAPECGVPKRRCPPWPHLDFVGVQSNSSTPV